MTLQNFTLGTFAQGAAGGGGAFESIATATGTGSSGVITFSSIPATYQHLQLRVMSKNSSTSTLTGIANTDITFNSDTGSNYSFHRLEGNGSAASASGSTSQPYIRVRTMCMNSGSGGTDMLGVGIVDILDYGSTSKNKTVRVFSGSDANTSSTSFPVTLTSGLWMSASAITTITLTAASGTNFTTQSTFALYGIKGA